MASTMKNSSALDKTSKIASRKTSIFDESSSKVKSILQYDIPTTRKFNNSMMTNYDMPGNETSIMNESDINPFISVQKRNSVGGFDSERPNNFA